MVPALLAELRRRDVRLWADGDRLRCTAPAGVLTPELRNQIQQRKTEILELLRSAETLAQQQRAIVPLQPHGTRVPVFAVAGHNGDVFCYRALTQHLGDDQPFFGLQPPGLDGHSEPLTSIEDLAAYFAAQIRAFRPDTPYVIAGYCAGGTIAFELAQQLLKQGAEIRFIALFASPYPTWYRLVPQVRHRLVRQMERVSRHAQALISRQSAERRVYLMDGLRRRNAEREADRLAASDPVMVLRVQLEEVTLRAVRNYAPRHFAGSVKLFLPGRRWLRDVLLRWRPLAQTIEEYSGPEDCMGDRMLLEPHVSTIADLFRRSYDNRTSAVPA